MSSSHDVVIDVQNLSKCYEVYASPREHLKQILFTPIIKLVYRLCQAFGFKSSSMPPCYYKEFWALRDVSFQVKRGEVFGIIGRNGGGKSTLLQILAGTLAPTGGKVKVSGRVAALLELGSGFNPEFTGRENIFLNGQILGLTHKEILSKYEEIVEFADIGDFIDQPVKTYSSGMYVRLAFAVQAHIDASIVIIDEALAVGDVFFRQKCYQRLEELRSSGAAILLVSHAMSEIEQFCDFAVLLDKGRQVFLGPAVQASKHYYLLHQPHNHSVLESSPSKIDDIDRPIKTGENFFWPADNQFIVADSAKQIGDGRAVCTRFVVCDEDGNRCNYFEQGQTAVFYYEFLLNKPIAVPMVGIVLQNQRGIIVHGKGSLEFGAEAPSSLLAGGIIQCIQKIDMNLEAGEYTFELGCATIDYATYKKMDALNHEQTYSRVIRLCHMPNAGVISVGLRNIHNGAQLTHHGVADLPGEFEFNFINS